MSVAVVLLVAGCGSVGGPGVPQQPARDSGPRGFDLFEERVVGAHPGCITCHSLEEGITLVGPSLFGVEGRAGERVPGLDAADYVRQSILDPDAFVVDGFDKGQMPDGWGEYLSAEQVDSLVEALLGS